MPGYKRRRKNDSWELTVTIGTDYTGKPQRFTRTVHCKNEREADRELAKFYTECEQGDTRASSKMTVSAMFRLFEEDYCKVNLKPSTIQRYETLNRKQIEPYLGKRKLSTVKRYDIQKWVNDLSLSGLSPKTVKSAWSLLNQMYVIAEKWDIITKNPCTNIDLPKIHKKEADYYNIDELKLLLNKVYEDLPENRLFCTVLLLELFTGMRLSELAGLKWKDMDFDRNVVHVRRQRQRINGKGSLEELPKTDSGIRDITVPASVMQLVRELKVRYMEGCLLQGMKWTDEFYVISHETMKPRDVKGMAAMWKNYEVPGLRKITFHQLRHTHTAILAHVGVDKYDISDRLGHSSFGTTLRTYMHILEHKDDKIADQLDVFVGSLSANGN